MVYVLIEINVEKYLLSMKNLMLFTFLLVLCCSCEPDHPVYEHNMTMSISGNARWSDDLLKFVTPVFYYTDADGEHEIIVEESMRNDDIWEMDDEVYDFNTESWKYDISYNYNNEETVYLRLKYLLKQGVEVGENSNYTFEHLLNVTNVMLTRHDKDKPYVISIYSQMGNKDLPEEVECPASDVDKYIDSLISHPLERKIILSGSSISVE